MQVSAFPAIFKAGFGRFPTCIGRRPIRPEMADTARFWPNQPGSARIEIDLARIEPHQRESSRVGANSWKKKKKKNADAVRRAGNRVGRRVPRRVASRPVLCCVGRGCDTSGAASVLSSFSSSLRRLSSSFCLFFNSFLSAL